ncbi:MAG: ComEA family DNA-binding protein [Thermomicrobiales bacterium]
MTKTRAILALVAVVAGVIAAYAIFRAWDDRAAPPIIISDSEVMVPVVVDLRGAVKTPGVYELPAGARVQDAIAAGGGVTENADLSTINLARRLRDGDVVVIAPLPSPSGTPGSAPEMPPVTTDGSGVAKVNLNTASAAELVALPGIGDTIAGRIVAYRDEHGPFRSIDDLIHVQGISAKLIDSLSDLVTVGP